MSDMFKKYKEIVPTLQKTLGVSNVMQVPKLEKIVLSTGIDSNAERDSFSEAIRHLGAITGQQPVITKAKKNVANFKLRVGMNSGVKVTLRGPKMYTFLNHLVHIALPRVRDFRGISPKGFDGFGNYNMGLDDISVFTQVDLDKLKYPLGFNITMVTSAKTNEAAFELLKLLDMPFADK